MRRGRARPADRSLSSPARRRRGKGIQGPPAQLLSLGAQAAPVARATPWIPFPPASRSPGMTKRDVHLGSDIDLVLINGYGYPAWRGGPMFHAARQGETG